MGQKWREQLHRWWAGGAEQALTSCFIVVMLTVFPCFCGWSGYSDITRSKYYFLLAATLLYLLALALCRLRRGGCSLRRIGGLWRRLSATQRLLAGYGLLLIFSALASPYFQLVWWGGGRYEGLLTMLVYLAIFMAVSTWGRFRPGYLYLLLIPVGLNIILSLLQLQGGNPLGLYPSYYDYFDGNVLYSGQFLGTIGNTGLLSAFFCLAVPAMLCYAVRERADRRAAALLAGAVVAALIMFRSGVAAGLVALLLTALIVIALLLPGRRLRWLYLLLLLLLLAVGLCWLSAYDGEPEGLFGEAAAIVQGEADGSFGSGRLAIWQETVELIGERPLLGGGPDTLGERLDFYFTRESDGRDSGYRTKVDTAHNDYLNIAANNGLPALALYVLALLSSLYGWVRHCRSTAVLVCGAAVLCYSIQIFFSFSLCITAPLFWIFWGLLESALKQQKNAR